ncbi:hypothetical protein [Viscerimonas tarda]
MKKITKSNLTLRLSRVVTDLYASHYGNSPAGCAGNGGLTKEKEFYL